MEAPDLIRPEFWESDVPVLLGGDAARGLPGPGLVYFRTSGSTGTPKWIGHERAALLRSAEIVNRHLGVGPGSVWGLALPAIHVGGFGVIARARLAGCGLAVFPGKWNAGVFAGWLAAEGVTHLSLVPTQVHDLVAAGLRAPAALRAIVVGGGLLPEPGGRAARELGWPVLASYGMTETASQVATQGMDLLEMPYVPAPLPLLDGWEAGEGEDGALSLRGPSLHAGTLLPDGAGGWKYEERRGGWLRTSDLVRVRGRDLFPAGRADTRVKILGELVDPMAVEAALLALLPEGGFAVTAVPDERAGHKLVVVHETGAPRLAAALAAYHADCPGLLRISTCVETDTLPRSPLGKTLRAEVARIAAERSN